MRKTTLDQLADPNWLRDARNYFAAYIFANGLNPSQLHDHLIDLYRDLIEPITDFCNARNREVEIWLPIEALEVSGIADWLEYFGTPVPDHIRPYLNDCSKERAIVVTSILRANDPIQTASWGQ